LRPWEEPLFNPYVGLCNLAHDVWAHLIGAGSKVDSIIAFVLLKQSGEYVLEFGAGAGYFVFISAVAGKYVDCLEVDPVKRKFIDFRFSKCEFESRVSTELIRVKYDSVCAINVLDYLENPSKSIEEFQKCLSDLGFLFLAAEFPNDGWHQLNSWHVIKPRLNCQLF